MSKLIPCKQCIVYAICKSKEEIHCKMLGRWLRNEIRDGRYDKAKREIQRTFNHFIETRDGQNLIVKGMELSLKMTNELQVKRNASKNRTSISARNEDGI